GPTLWIVLGAVGHDRCVNPNAHPFSPERGAMNRRQMLGASASLAAAAFDVPVAQAAAGTATRVRPGGPGWPSQADWSALSQAVGGRLSPVRVPDLTGADAKALLANPFYLGDQ